MGYASTVMGLVDVVLAVGVYEYDLMNAVEGRERPIKTSLCRILGLPVNPAYCSRGVGGS